MLTVAMTLSDLSPPQHVSTFCDAFSFFIFVTGKIESSNLVYRLPMKSYLTDDKGSLKGAWSCTLT